LKLSKEKSPGNGFSPKAALFVFPAKCVLWNFSSGFVLTVAFA
jgi:hypothetical protein